MTEIWNGPFFLGSWQTLELLDDADGIALLSAARQAGIATFDVARYGADNGGLTGDEAATEAAFARFLAGAGVDPDGVAVTGKIWFDRWPQVSAEEEVQASLKRLDRAQLDLVYLEEIKPGVELSCAEAVRQLVPVLEAGLARAWGLGSWGPAGIAEALAEADRLGLEPPAALQIPYSVVWRGSLESPEMQALLEEHHLPVVASAPMAYGLLTGKYRGAEVEGRMAPIWQAEGSAPVRQVVAAYLDLARRHQLDPGHLALAFCLRHPHVRAVVFGSRRADQLRHNVAARDILDRLDDQVLWEELQALPRLA